jgi:hypothetical protein
VIWIGFSKAEQQLEQPRLRGAAVGGLSREKGNADMKLLRGDKETCSSTVFVAQRPKNFVDWGGMVSLLDTFGQDCIKFYEQAGSPEERDRLLKQGKLCDEFAAKLWHLHEAGEGLPRRICLCKQAYVAKGKRFCLGCAKERRRISNLEAQRKWREKQRE